MITWVHSVLVSWNSLWERANIQWKENMGMEQALIEKVMTLLKGMNNHLASIYVDAYCILPHIQLPDRFLGHVIGLKAKGTRHHVNGLL